MVTSIPVLSELPSVPFSSRASLPTERAVYFVLGANNTVLYVGATKNLRKRWKQHHLTRELRKTPQVRIAWLVVSGEDAALTSV